MHAQTIFRAVIFALSVGSILLLAFIASRFWSRQATIASENINYQQPFSMLSGHVILLNGTSSVGKSAILHEFKKVANDYRILKVDDWFPAVLKAKAIELGWAESSQTDPWLYLYDYMAKKTGKYYFATELRELLFNDSVALYQQAKDAAFAGKNVIIDTVLEYEREYVEFEKFFHGTDLDVKKVLVYCPLDILLHRVEKRNAAGIAEEMRTAFQSFEQFPAIFKTQEHANESIVDVVQSSVLKQALDDAIKQLIDHGVPAPYLPRLEEFRKNFIAQFKLDEREEITLVPRHAYDLILNSGTSTAKELATQIKLFLDQAEASRPKIMEKKQIMLPIPTGAFPVGTTTYQLVDTSRKEKYSHDPKHPFRELVMQIWYPAMSTGNEPTAPYISPHLKSHIQEVIAQKDPFLFGGAGYLDADILTHEFYNAPINNAQLHYPVIIFSHGFGGARYLYTSLYEELVSHGYIVVAVNHTYTSEPTEFEDGRIVRAAGQEWSEFMQDIVAMEKAHNAEMVTWVADIQFVLDQLMAINDDPKGKLTHKLDLNHIGIAGHSFGGSVATALCRIDARCKAGVDMDGPLFGENQDIGFDKPFMFVFAEPFKVPADAPNKEYYDEMLRQNEQRMNKLYKALTNDAYYFTVEGADHMSFSDWNLITKTDKVDAQKKVQIARALLVNFFDKYLKDMARSVLEGINMHDIIAK